jgi:tetratricopeptide (TPR) repeat protein
MPYFYTKISEFQLLRLLASSRIIMLFIRYTSIAVLLTIFVCHSRVLAQRGIDLDIKKPPEYDNRVLRSEKSDRKKFRIPSRIVQNTTTHYNFYFNANNKLNEVIEKAKLSNKDDYSRLLPFYNYSLDVTAADTILLDSVSYKAQSGIVLHDLRGDWIDNMYLLWGISYYLKKQHDSAYLMFQFINYAFAEKESDGYYKTIGSNMDGNSAFSVSSKENKSLRRIFYHQPIRNDAFVWQIRNFIIQEKYTQAASLISILKNDPRFPARLQNDLEEMQALFFYQQKIWDSAAVHLSKALDNAPTKNEKARWEYLAGQLYEMSGMYDEAEEAYAKAIQHTVDPVMEIYARLASVRVNRGENDNYIRENIATLVKMAKKDKYSEYRDIIYYMAAQMELEQHNTDGAIAMLQKSVAQRSNNASQRNKAFLQLAELLFTQKQYRPSYNFYDSISLNDPALKDVEAITKRKDILRRLTANIEIIERQDSLQRLAAMPEDERRDFVKKLVRQLRRQQGLKDEGVVSASAQQKQQTPVSLFDDNKKGEWYFYNTNLRQKGQAEFKAKWGNRPNTDNWRRSAAFAGNRQQQVNNNNSLGRMDAGGAQTASGEKEITFDALYEKLPLSQLKMAQSDDSINAALFALGLIYIQELEDCASGTEVLEKLRQRVPDHPKMDEILFNLYYCSKQRGGNESLYTLKRELTEKYPTSNFTTIVNTGKNPQAEGLQEEPTRAYEKIYDLFIEGNFHEAIAQKKRADSIYNSNYWTPQLLYIESVYYVKQQEDSIAKISLNNIIKKFPGTVMADKAATMIDVLNRRQEIEEELRNMVINMPAPDTTRRYTEPDIQQPEIVRKGVADTVKTKITDPSLVINTRPADTLQQKPMVPQQPVIQQPVVQQPVAVQPPPSASGFTFETDKPHYVLLMMNKVDPVFVSEARNAFYRYNRSTYYNRQMNAELVQIDNDNHFLLISPFKTMQEAIEYIDQTRPKTATEIIPWLKGGKYSFSVITEKNLDTLKNTKDIDKYRSFLEEHLPGKF